MTAGHREAGRRRDWDLLLQACRAERTGLDLAARVAERFPGRRAGDWDGFLGLMDGQGAALLAGSALLSIDEDVVPEEVRAALEDRIRLGTLRAKIQVPELLAILEALEGRGIDAIAHKGPALSALAYGRAGVRDSVDLDVLVHGSDVTAAERVLRERGYRRHSPGDLGPREEAGWR
ncbi:MAG TPA: nucleotidyltransferase family protein, partial [Vicinamibacteria bacterium]|nr:nucleotidyltransferase family protein [Vicinamibacteria bacterium]